MHLIYVALFIDNAPKSHFRPKFKESLLFQRNLKTNFWAIDSCCCDQVCGDIKIIDWSAAVFAQSNYS